MAKAGVRMRPGTGVIMMRRLTAVAFLVFSGLPSASQSKEDMLKAAINLNGLLCAKVVDTTLLKIADQLEVTCVEYRGGKGRVRYIYNLKTGRAFKA